MSTWLVYAGASSARLSSLESGAVDAAILTAPFNFYGASAGLSIIGRTADYITDLPQNGTVVNRNWATGHMSALSRFLAAFNKGVVPENSIRWDSRGEAESAHHPMRCLRSSICLRRL